MPARHVIQIAVIVLSPDRTHVCGLFSGFRVLANKGWITENECCRGRFRKYLRPVQLQRVVMDDRCGDFNRQRVWCFSDFRGEEAGCSLIHEEHGAMCAVVWTPVHIML